MVEAKVSQEIVAQAQKAKPQRQAPTKPAAAAPKKPTAKAKTSLTNGRPFTPEQLRGMIDRKAAQIAKEKPGMETKPASADQRGLLRSLLTEAFAPHKHAEDHGRLTLAYFTGDESTKPLTMAWASAAISWILRKGTGRDGDGSFQIDPMARQEAMLVLNAGMKARGQQELPTTKGETA